MIHSFAASSLEIILLLPIKPISFSHFSDEVEDDEMKRKKDCKEKYLICTKKKNFSTSLTSSTTPSENILLQLLELSIVRFCVR